MKEYTIMIEETVSHKVRISAQNEDEAMRTISDMYKSGNIVLDPGEVIDVKFGIEENEPRKHILIFGEAYIKEDNISFNSDTFVENLDLIDSTIPKMFAYMLSEYIRTGKNSIKYLTEKCARENICGVKSRYFVFMYYTKKISDFLYAALHGLKFDETWNGECKTKGFYIFDNGVSFSMYDLKNMLDYIYENAYIEIVDKVAMGERTKYTWQICL